MHAILKVVVYIYVLCSLILVTDLLRFLQAARVKIQSLESSVESFLARESKMKHLIRSLEQEKASYQKTIERMRSSLPQDAAAEVEMTQLKSICNDKTKAASKKPWPGHCDSEDL